MKSGNEDRKPRVLLTIQGGGFFWQSRSVARALAQEFELSYVSSSLASSLNVTSSRLSRVYSFHSSICSLLRKGATCAMT